MKTRLEWFNTMPEPYRSQAIENEDPDKLNEKYDSLCGALELGFYWMASPQGDRYWYEAAHGNFPQAVKESNELRVTKDRVLEAAERCSTTKEALKILFPSAFEDDKAVDLTGMKCEKYFGMPGLRCGEYYFVWYVPDDNQIRLYNRYKWEIQEQGDILVLIPTKK